jgi:citrate synthase
MKWLTSDDACEILGIKPASLYAYVSRGLVRARTATNDPRASLYASADIDHLLSRKRAGRKRDSIARGAIGWGEPILESAITTVQDGRLIYRGLDAVMLSQDQTLEEVATLLWGGDRGVPEPNSLSHRDCGTSSKDAGFLYLAAQAGTGRPCAEQSLRALTVQASSLLDGLSSAMALGHKGATAHQRLAGLWGLNDQQGDIVRRALVLLADHELNPSTFAARIAASTGASLAACALAGYATLTGPLHGEAATKALEFLTQAHSIGPTQAITALKTEGTALAGLGHKLYPEGDPRARALLAVLRPYPMIAQTIADAEAAWQAPANIDMALAALTLALRLPYSAPFTLFAVARMAGWLAHGIEQSLEGALIRPRARYVGKKLS